MSRAALVVDDSTTMQEMVSFTLTRAGFAVTRAGNGQEALSRLKGTRFDLIITDLNMPVMDGISFIREMRAKPAYKFTPVLMLTTESGDAVKKQGKAVGATGWLVKPFNPDQMLQVVAKVVP
jgi:two-component system chemotaxis response regulator CheY